MNKSIFLNLLAKHSAGTLTEKEKIRLEKAIDENPYYRSIYTEFQYYISQKSTVEMDVEAKLEEIWLKIESEMPVPEISIAPKRIVPMWMKVASVVLVLIGAGFFLRQYTQSKPELYTQSISTADEKLFLTLDDGTQVWLNEHSTLEYNENFGSEKRELRLTGEAFFDVAHNAQIPFRVHSQTVDVTVKGTAFNVNAKEKDKVEVALLRGLVAVTSKQLKNKEILLHPNQRLTMQNGEKLALDTIIKPQIAENADTIPKDVKWTNSQLNFNREKLVNLAKLMENRYGVQITITNEKLKSQRFTGSITDESLAEMLEALRLSYPFEYEISNKKVIIR
ncbi:MAG TPA: DUF4974 domain-containing protein [Bacteroidales bacterium]|nr:DUF4974 domain-containing protein [Bacteroidales bacterium]